MCTVVESDLRGFAENGYLVLHGVVPEQLLAAADTEIDNLIRDSPPREGDGGPGQNAWFMPRSHLPRCEDVLRRSSVLDSAEQLVSPGTLAFATNHIQVATTVPPWSHVPGGPHIDGHGPGEDPPGSFTLLVGVLLTDQSVPQSGNLWVWPGSHLAHQRLFQERGTRVLQTSGGHSTALDPPLTLSKQRPILGGRGTVVLAHFLLGHNKGGNVLPTVRRTIYYRLAVPGHSERWEQTFLDPWTEYPPITRLRDPERPVSE